MSCCGDGWFLGEPLPPLRRQLSWHFNNEGQIDGASDVVGPASRINLRTSFRMKRGLLSLQIDDEFLSSVNRGLVAY